MSKPFVVSVNFVSGGGKTALAWLVHAWLAESVLYCFAAPRTQVCEYLPRSCRICRLPHLRNTPSLSHLFACYPVSIYTRTLFGLGAACPFLTAPRLLRSFRLPFSRQNILKESI